MAAVAALRCAGKVDNLQFLKTLSRQFSGVIYVGLEKKFIAATGSTSRLSCPFILKEIHTTAFLEKRQSPRTVGIPAWKKASIDRKQFVARLRKPKDEETVKAEMRLENQEKELSLFTTSRIRNIPKEQETVTRLQPEIFLSKDGNTVICYHPKPSYPKEKTRPSLERQSWHGERSIMESYNEGLTEAQEAEAKRLREADPKLWTAGVLGHMLKVNPSVINEKLPLSSEQLFELEVERKLLSGWGRSKRLDYKKYQNLEIIEYIRNTRGDVAVMDFRKIFDI